MAAIEAGFMQDEIERASFDYVKAIDDGEKIIVGVNRYVDEEAEPPDVFPIDPAMRGHPDGPAQRVRAERDASSSRRRPRRRARCGAGHPNLLRPMREALRRMATLGEVSDVLREEFGSTTRPGEDCEDCMARECPVPGMYP